MTPRRAELLFCGGLVAALVLLQTAGLTRPFLRQHESNGTGFGKCARNHVKFGLRNTYGLLLDVSGPRLDAYSDYREHFYSNHPPMVGLLLAGVFAIFGVSEAVYRSTFIALSVLALLLFRRLAARLVPAPWDRAATAFFAFFPMFVYYSIVTGLQVIALIGVLSTLLFYLRWREEGRRSDYAGIAGSIALACYSSWEGYYAAPALVVAHFWSRRPGKGPVLALLGVNLAVFGIYLLHLRAADPVRLAPLKSLFEAGVSRTLLEGLSIPRYVAGEARELALMFTVPAILLAGVWVVSILRGPRTENDGLIAGLSLLGLHEVVFPKLASQHEYYSYGLVVFMGLAASRGLSIVAGALEGGSRLAVRTVLTATAVGFAAQGGWTLDRRLTREGGYEFYHRLALAMGEAAAPEDRLLILTDNIPFYTPFYADLYSQWYDAPHRELLRENTGGRQKGVTEEDLERLLRENPGRLDWAVSAEKATVVPQVPWLRTLDEGQLESFGVETHRTARRDLLERLCGPPRIHRGFLFWSLPGRR